ncbi:MAG: ribosome biogenesis GTPase Der, partial [Candidatus Omnitrophica bacterium]|nr:ribosome biogenesis GTPase Der [Candidatus Omnitrophota bacterium]
VKIALEEAEVILFVCDISSEITAFDREAADLVRKKNKKVVLAVNKADSEKIAQGAADFFQLGLGTPYPVSSLHGLGVGEILDEIVSLISPAKEEVFSGPKFAIVGKPNVGKSSFLNALLGEERVVVDARPGTTRDAVDTVMIKDGCEILLIDTAGIKHKSRLKENLEFYATLRSWEAISRADICIMLIDAYGGMASDDVRILNSAWDEGRPLVLAVNKWDLIENLDTKKYKDMMKKRTHLAEEVPICFLSCLKRQNILEPINIAQDLYSKIDLKISTPRLNEFLKKTLQKLSPPTVSGRRPNFLYIVQVKSRQPAFKVFVSDPF